MGRRKIEIQPISNERNRSVTFLKRKNGLFKKAYELGVLCSVDVAVIIFDERHGHDSKLFQYSSTDIRDIVQRHLRHNGERDTRGPADFSGEGGSSKNDAGGDGDDDDDDGDAEEPAPPTTKRKSSVSKGKGKDDDEFISSSARVIAEPETKQRASISNERSAPERARSSTQLSTFPQYDHQHPVSSDRLHPRPYQDHPSKKARLDYPLDLDSHGHSLSAASSEDSIRRTHEALYMYPPHPPFRRPSEASHQNPSPYAPYGMPYPASPPPGHHSYGSPFHSPPPDFSLGPWGRTHGPGSAGPGPGGLSAFFSGSHMGPPSFDGLPPFARGDDREGPSDKNGHGRDTFAHTFLEAEQQRKVALPHAGMSISRGTTSAASFGLDWPSHRSGASSHATPTPPQASTTPKSPRENGSNDGNGNGAAAPVDGGPAGWLELLSGAGDAPAAANTLRGSSEAPIPTPRSGSAAPSSAS
ncbi:hypothetical protein C0991_001764 [Blastosporella zonata]|nr:hypothetical protein C0991_001764 [Blastosporella zonata]